MNWLFGRFIKSDVKEETSLKESNMLKILNKVYDALFELFETTANNGPKDPMEIFVDKVVAIVEDLEDTVVSGLLDDFVSFFSAGAIDFHTYLKLRQYFTVNEINENYADYEMSIMDREDYDDSNHVPADFITPEEVLKHFSKVKKVNFKKDGDVSYFDKIMKGRDDLRQRIMASMSVYNTENPMFFASVIPFKPAPSSLLGMMKKGISPAEKQGIETISRTLAGAAVVSLVNNELVKAFLFGAAFSSPLKMLAKAAIYKGSQAQAYGALCNSKKKDEEGNPIATEQRLMAYIKPGVLAVVPTYMAKMKGKNLFNRLVKK